MNKPICACCDELSRLMREHRFQRATISIEYFRGIVQRQRIEGTFLESLNDMAIAEYDIAIIRVSRTKFIVVRTSDKYFKDDPCSVDNYEE